MLKLETAEAYTVVSKCDSTATTLTPFGDSRSTATCPDRLTALDGFGEGR